MRIAAAVVLAQDGFNAFYRDQAWSWTMVVAVALFLAAGFLTPIWALLIAVTEITRLLPHNLSEWPIPLLVASILLALAVLGPGAYSIDRWLFGRKRLTIGRPPN